MGKPVTINNTKLTKPPLSGRLDACGSADRGAIVLGSRVEGSAVTIYSEGLRWAISPMNEEGVILPFELASADIEGSYALIKGDGFTLKVARYSASAITIKAEGERSYLCLSVVCKNYQNIALRATEARHKEYQSIVLTPNEGSYNGLEARVYGEHGNSVEASSDGALIRLSWREDSASYLLVGGARDIGSKELSLSELERGISYLSLKEAGSRLVCSGLGFAPAGITARALSYKCFDEHIGDYAYIPYKGCTRDDMLMGAIVGLLAGDRPLKQIASLAGPDALSAIAVWLAFMRTRNHAFLAECYAKIKGDYEDYIVLDVLERASRVLGRDENASIKEKMRAKVLGVYPEGTPLYALYSYLMLKRRGDELALARLIENCALQPIEGGLLSLIYPLIALNGYLDVEYFMDDICPSVSFGKLSSGEIKLKNQRIFGLSGDIRLDDEVTELVIGGVKVFEAVGGRAVIWNFKEETGGCSFFIKALAPLTVYLDAPIFNLRSGRRERFNLRIGEGVSRVRIINRRVFIEGV